MASSINEQQFQWSASDSITITTNTQQVSDAIMLNVEDWNGSIQVSVDNSGSAASGDTLDCYALWSNGDVLGDTGNDFDTSEHAQFIGRLDTYATNTPGEDPARRTWGLNLSGKVALKLAVTWNSGLPGTRNAVVRARLVTHRPQ